MRVLVVEDEPAVQTLISAILEKNGHEVEMVDSADEAENIALQNKNDIIILDLGLPDGNGFDVCKKLRQKALTTPILILSGKQETDTKIKCLNAGADDYLTKPFDSSELIARLEAISRRSYGDHNKGKITCDELELNLIDRTLKVNGNPVTLTNNEFNMLAYMMEREGITLSRQKLSKDLWGIDFDTQTNYINVYISYLRKKIREYAHQKYIDTVRHEGFVFRNPSLKN